MRDIRRIAVSDNLAVVLCSRITSSDSEPVNSIENLGMTDVIPRDMRRCRRDPSFRWGWMIAPQASSVECLSMSYGRIYLCVL